MKKYIVTVADNRNEVEFSFTYAPTAMAFAQTALENVIPNEEYKYGKPAGVTLSIKEEADEEAGEEETEETEDEED